MQAKLSHYQIREQIGAGAFGVVYRAYDEHLECDVALKVLSPGKLSDDNARKRFRKEALALSRLNHPNIAVVHDFDSQDGTDFLVEELIPGLSLAEMLESGPLSEPEIVNLGSQLADALAAAHDRGIIHRDLKPENIRITPDARVKVLDFGLAVMLHRELPPDAITESLSEPRPFAGTLPYMAPEQVLGRQLDGRADIWALGCILFEMAAGGRPFSGSTHTLLDSILHDPPPELDKLNPTIGRSLVAVIQKCLQKEPAQRYPSANEIAVDLRTSSSPAVVLPRPRKKGTLGFALAILLVLAGLFYPRIDSLYKKWFSSKHQVAYQSYLQGMKHLQRWDKRKDLDAAIDSFQQAVKADPKSAVAYSALGQAHWAKYRMEKDPKWMEEAEKDCTRAAEISDSIPEVFVTRALVHNGKGQNNLALEEVQKAISLEPRNPNVQLAQGVVLGDMDRLKEAEESFKTAVALRPDSWTGNFEYGVFLYKQHRVDEAIAVMQQGLDLTPDNAVLHSVLGGLLQINRHDTEAEKHLLESLRLESSYNAYTNLSALYIRQRRYADAAATLKKALELNGSDWKTWSNLAMSYEWLNRKHDAELAMRNELTLVEAAEAVKPNDAEIQVELALLYSNFKDARKARPHIDAALAMDPDDPVILTNAAEACELLGDRSRALELVRKAMTHGRTPAQLERDFGLRNLLRDPQFAAMAKQFKNTPSPALTKP